MRSIATQHTCYPNTINHLCADTHGFILVAQRPRGLNSEPSPSIFFSNGPQLSTRELTVPVAIPGRNIKAFKRDRPVGPHSRRLCFSALHAVRVLHGFFSPAPHPCGPGSSYHAAHRMVWPSGYGAPAFASTGRLLLRVADRCARRPSDALVDVTEPRKTPSDVKVAMAAMPRA